MAKIIFNYIDGTNTILSSCDKTAISKLRKFIDNITSVDDARYILAPNNKLNQVIFLRHVKYITIEEDK